ncbi:glycosyltransferase family 2 protein [Piscinibacter sakaiensis]|uniref:Glycosyl transferase, family 2 n=1 Tax=Piscinibacter sakaiensis TaxID=1547922 RepID=A0A0K8P111_PISS1|nr:glycosyltransferase family 2 protein [Piscinibacter sakaiensis]GAP35860.1 glycosyl transferase, family 2 [Piscinibacter sakaiensis]
MSAPPLPRVSVIVVNWNVRALLHECLRSLYADGGLPADALQVIVVDNASHDGSVAMVRADFPQVECIANADNVGFGRANNQVLDRCRAPFVLLLNPDTRVLPGAIASLLQVMDEDPRIAAVGARLLNADGSLQRWTGGAYPRLANVANHYLFVDRLLPRRWRLPPLYLDHDAPRDLDVDWVSGAVMLLRGSALGGRLFDPDYFMYGEDMALCHRLKQAGGRIVYTPRASFVHYQGESMKQQQGDVLLSSLKGPRQFYRKLRGERAVRLYDLVTVAGFGLRWAAFGLAARWRGDPALAARAASSAGLARRAWRIFRDPRAG